MRAIHFFGIERFHNGLPEYSYAHSIKHLIPPLETSTMNCMNTSNQYLLRAVARGSLQGTMQAIEDGADINIQDYNGQTPLHISFLRNNLAVADFLMQLGARDDIRDLNGLTPRNMADCALSQKNNQSKRCKALPFGANAEAALKCNFPANVVDAMIRTQQVTAVTKSSVSILFLDVVGFSKMRGAMAPVKILSMLQRLFGAFDALATHHGVERIDTIDGCYMAATNFSNPQSTDHAVRLAIFAIEAIHAAASVQSDVDLPEQGTVRLLAGMHCGAVCGSLVGAHGSRKHTIHGDAVNVASRMESHGTAGRAQCSPAAAQLIEAQGGCSREGLRLTQRAEDVDVKGIGRMRTFWLAGALSQHCLDVNESPATCRDLAAKTLAEKIPVGPCQGCC